MHCRSIICAESIIIDVNSRKTSAFNLIEDTTSDSYPIAMPFMIYSTYEKSNNEEIDAPNIAIQITFNDQPLFAPIALNINFKPTSRISKNVIHLGLLPIPSEGKLAIKILFNDVPLRERDIMFKRSRVVQEINFPEEGMTAPAPDDQATS